MIRLPGRMSGKRLASSPRPSGTGLRTPPTWCGGRLTRYWAHVFCPNLFVGGPVIVVLFAIVHHDGRFGLVADDQDPVALGAFLYLVIKTGRWWRESSLWSPRPDAPRNGSGRREVLA